MAARANAKTVKIRSSHAAMVSHPRAVTALILAAVAGPKWPADPARHQLGGPGSPHVPRPMTGPWRSGWAESTT